MIQLMTGNILETLSCSPLLEQLILLLNDLGVICAIEWIHLLLLLINFHVAVSGARDILTRVEIYRCLRSCHLLLLRFSFLNCCCNELLLFVLSLNISALTLQSRKI